MKKILLSVAMLAVCGMASAQTPKLTYVPYNTGDSQNAFLMGENVSPNGRYVCGGDNEKGFICDMTTGEVKTFKSEFLGEEGVSDANSTINGVSNDGVGYGYMESEAAKFDFSTGTYEKLTKNLPATVSAVNGENTFAVGYTYDEDMTNRSAVYWENGEMKQLPTPTEAWLGFTTDGFQATAVSQDGATIVGFAVDNFDTKPLIVWHRNTDGTFSVTPVCKRFADLSWELDGPQKYDYFNAECISGDGKWIAVTMHTKETDESGTTGMSIGRYNVDTEEFEEIECPDNNENDYYANAIANDGTIVGTVEGTGRYGIIVKAGETKAQYLAEAYPSVTEIAAMEELQDNCPTDITPDGRYILGFGGIVSPLNEKDQWTATWLLDTGKVTTEVTNAATDETAHKVVATYNIEGKKLNKNNVRRNSLVINRLANGKAVKNIAK